MRRIVIGLTLVAGASALAASSPALRLDRLAGRYSHVFTNGFVDGSKYRSENVVEVRPVDAKHADVALSLEFYNGHSCWIEGRARVEGRKLVLRVADYDEEGGAPCKLELWTDRTRLHWSDGDNTCKAGCGARGTFSKGSVLLSSKRKLPAQPLSPEG